MKIRRLRVTRFRGIKELDWHIPHDFVVLVGPGDSCKTTILEAIELALFPRWNPAFSDNDFHESSTDEPISIEVSVGDLPPYFLADHRFGLDLQGLSPNGSFSDEPQEGDERILVVRLTVDSSLEPTWRVVNSRLPEGKSISADVRARLGVVRLGRDVSRQLAWSRGSALAKITASTEEVAQVLASAQREMRAAVGAASLTQLDKAIEDAKKAASRMGAGKLVERLRAALLADGISPRLPGLALHSGNVPVQMAGLATQRLVALGVQQLSVEHGAVTLVDEVEAGLEPFRVRHLLSELRKSTGELDDTEQPRRAQVFMTTHSSVVLEEARASDVCVVRVANGEVSVHRADDGLQAVLRRSSETFLARRIVLCAKGRRRLASAWGFAAVGGT